MTEIISQVTVAPGCVTLNSKVIPNPGLSELYREFVGNYPKFFKMDYLCKLGFIAAEFLLRDIPAQEREDCAVILFNRSGSLVTDRNFEKTIIDDENFFPSPSIFVYTLANIVTGEIAIRNKIYGETSFYVLDHNDPEQMEQIVNATLTTSSPSLILYGWVDYIDENDYLADFNLIRVCE